jgi:hypothetical protein
MRNLTLTRLDCCVGRASHRGTDAAAGSGRRPEGLDQNWGLSNMRVTFGAACLAAVLALGCGSALALEEDKGEKDRLAQCEKDLCSILVKKEAGADLMCNLQKTWAGKSIKEGVESKKLTWGFGDARCTMDLKVSRQEMIDALTKPEFEYKLGTQQVRCEVEREKEVMKITVALAPKFQFKDGKAVKAWLGVGEIEAPAVLKAGIWTAAKLEDTFGIVHSDLLREINEFVYQRCPKKI